MLVEKKDREPVKSVVFHAQDERELAPDDTGRVPVAELTAGRPRARA